MCIVVPNEHIVGMAYRNRLNGIKFLQISHFMHAPFILPHNIYMRSCDHKLCDVTSPNVYHAEHRLTGFLSVIFSDSEKHNFFHYKKHLKNVGPIRHCEPSHALILHCHSPGVATVARRHCRTPPAHRCPQQRQRQRQRVTEGTAMAP